MTSSNKAFGTAVRRRLKALGLNQEELAYQAGLRRTYINLIERGLRSASIETIIKPAGALSAAEVQLPKDVEAEVSEHLGQ